MEEKIKYLLDKIIENKEDSLKVEYISNKLKECIRNFENIDLCKQIIKQYNQEDLNTALRQSAKEYNKRLREILSFELIYFFIIIVLAVLGFLYIRFENIDLNMRVLFSITFVLIYVIFRSGKIKKKVKDNTNKEFEENLSNDFRKEIDDKFNK
ncbi:hypothetical protein [Caviibacter abscessus]|uniref:hypothetical protein n=1 Tax=Caviibacter abscessus TaxID=1766719 RepID=UPI00082F3A94|nr:hypothetical protein [Caviibacter abscessus]